MTSYAITLSNRQLLMCQADSEELARQMVAESHPDFEILAIVKAVVPAAVPHVHTPKPPVTVVTRNPTQGGDA